jgi:CubicO group peptidase (beta-lactamase class C family)
VIRVEKGKAPLKLEAGWQANQLGPRGCYLDSRRRLREVTLALFVCALAFTTTTAAGAQMAGPPDNNVDIQNILEPIRAQFDVPAMGGAIVTRDGMVMCGVVGVRKRGTNVPVETKDRWHLGSDTKAMTALLCARLVEQGVLTWDSTLGQVVAPQAGAHPNNTKAGITLAELLHHTSGLPPNLKWRSISQNLPLHQQRLIAARRALSQKLLFPPGTDFKYSNLGYTMAGTMAECATGKPWEELIEEYVFGPLQMHTREGPQCEGCPPLSEPWGHGENGNPVCGDNALVMAPAGCINTNLANWSKFIAEVLRGAAGQPGLVGAQTFQTLYTPTEVSRNYAGGWIITPPKRWAGGPAMNHVGSNTMNVANAWLGPNRGFAVLTVCNQGGEAANKACGKASTQLIRYWNAQMRQPTPGDEPSHQEMDSDQTPDQ